MRVKKRRAGGGDWDGWRAPGAAGGGGWEKGRKDRKQRECEGKMRESGGRDTTSARWRGAEQVNAAVGV